jgi:hypothetical protein
VKDASCCEPAAPDEGSSPSQFGQPAMDGNLACSGGCECIQRVQGNEKKERMECLSVRNMGGTEGMKCC